MRRLVPQYGNQTHRLPKDIQLVPICAPYGPGNAATWCFKLLRYTYYILPTDRPTPRGGETGNKIRTSLWFFVVQEDGEEESEGDDDDSDEEGYEDVYDLIKPLRTLNTMLALTASQERDLFKEIARKLFVPQTLGILDVS